MDECSLDEFSGMHLYYVLNPWDRTLWFCTKTNTKTQKDTDWFALCLFLSSKVPNWFRPKTKPTNHPEPNMARWYILWPVPSIKGTGSQSQFPGRVGARNNFAWHRRRTLEIGSLDSWCKIASFDIQEHRWISLGREITSAPFPETRRNTPSTRASNNSTWHPMPWDPRA